MENPKKIYFLFSLSQIYIVESVSPKPQNKLKKEEDIETSTQRTWHRFKKKDRFQDDNGKNLKSMPECQV